MNPSHFYVSAINGDRRYLVAGPYPTHDEAKDKVGTARDIAYERDRSGRAWFMAWGTAGSEGELPTLLGVV